MMEVGRDRTDEWSVELRRWIEDEGCIPALQVMSDHCYKLANDLSEVEPFLAERWQRAGREVAYLFDNSPYEW